MRIPRFLRANRALLYLGACTYVIWAPLDTLAARRSQRKYARLYHTAVADGRFASADVVVAHVASRTGCLVVVEGYTPLSDQVWWCPQSAEEITVHLAKGLCTSALDGAVLTDQAVPSLLFGGLGIDADPESSSVPLFVVSGNHVERRA